MFMWMTRGRFWWLCFSSSCAFALWGGHIGPGLQLGLRRCCLCLAGSATHSDPQVSNLTILSFSFFMVEVGQQQYLPQEVILRCVCVCVWYFCFLCLEISTQPSPLDPSFLTYSLSKPKKQLFLPAVAHPWIIMAYIYRTLDSYQRDPESRGLTWQLECVFLWRTIHLFGPTFSPQ